MSPKFQNRILRAIQKGVNEALNFQVLTNDEPEDNFAFNGDIQQTFSIDQEIQNAINSRTVNDSILNLAKSSNQPTKIIKQCEDIYCIKKLNFEENPTIYKYHIDLFKIYYQIIYNFYKNL